MHEQIQAVKDVLAEIDNDVPVLNVYNKIDLTDEPAHIGYASEGQPNRVYVSSRENLGMEELSLAVQQLLTGTLTTFELTLPYHAGQLKNALYELGVIQEESYDDSGHECLTIRLPSDTLRQLLGQANLEPLDVLPLAQATLLMPVLEDFEKPDEVEEPTMTEAEEKAFDDFDALNSEAAKSEELAVEAETPDLKI